MREDDSRYPPLPAGDRIQTWEHGSITCAIMAGLMSLNGYIRFPEDHPWLSLDDLDDIEAPGGITYSCDHWIGFDTAHGFDVWDIGELKSAGWNPPPGRFPEGYPQRMFAINASSPGAIHWTLTRLQDEVNALAERAAIGEINLSPDSAHWRASES